MKKSRWVLRLFPLLFPLMFIAYALIAYVVPVSRDQAQQLPQSHLDIVQPESAQQRGSGKAGPLPVFADRRETWQLSEGPHVRAMLVVDVDQRAVLYAKNPHQVYPVASLTKIFLMDELFDRMKSRAGGLSMDIPVEISRTASLVGGSQVYLREGSSTTVRDLIKAAMIHSANDASYLIGELLGAGNADRTVEILNNKARSLGLRNTRFSNVHGLPEPRRPDNVSTASEVARMTWKLLRDHPELFGIASTEVDYFVHESGHRFMLVNRNRPMVRLPYVDGLKTGYTANAGFCLVATSNKNGRRLIVVVLGAPDKHTRNRAAQKLIDHFSEVRRVGIGTQQSS